MKRFTMLCAALLFATGVVFAQEDPVDTLEFVQISDGDYLEAPIEWTQYTYDLSNYKGEIQFAIQYVSYDAFIFMMDHFTVMDGDSELFADSFEGYNDFAIDLSPWITWQVTEGITWAASAFDFTNEEQEWAYMAFNPSQTVDPIDGDKPAYDGDKYAVAIQYHGENDNKWLVSPPITLPDDGAAELSFYAMSYHHDYGAERFRVYLKGEEKPVAAPADVVKNDVSIYPNPSNGVFNIETSERGMVEVFNINGKTIKSFEVTGNTMVELETAGLYFVKVSNANGTSVKKVVVE